MTDTQSEKEPLPEAAASSEVTASPQAAPSPPPGNRVTLIAMVILTCALIVISIFFKPLRDSMFPKRWGVVTPNLIFRSGQLSPTLLQNMYEEHNLVSVLALNGGSADEIKVCKKLGIDISRYSLRGDGTGDVNEYIDVLCKIDKAVKAGQPILIHCTSGAQRTGVAIGTYRMLVQHWTAKQVVHELLENGWHRDDLPLIDYVNEHLPTIAAALKERGVIDTIPNPLPKLDPNL